MNEQQWEEFYNRMRKAFKQYLKFGSSKKFYKLLPDIKYMYQNKYLKVDPDSRSGDETYGYEDGISNNMEYISDRWGCSFRLRWLIDGLERGLICSVKK